MKTDNIRINISEEKKPEYQYDFNAYNQPLTANLEEIIKGLRGTFIAKSDNLLLRLTAICFILVGISGLIHEYHSNIEFDYTEAISCLLIIGLGILIITITMGYIYFDDIFIKSVGLYNNKRWSIAKEQIKKVELAEVKHSFSKNYWIYVTSDNSERVLNIDHEMISYIEKVSGKSVKTMVNRIEYLSPPITFKNIIRILLLLIVIFGTLYGIFILLLKMEIIS
jgi:hypothetical protein